jgi:hypothetical protein
VNETDLQAAFAEIRGQDAPPHGLTPDALLAAGKQAQRRRRQMITAGAILTAALAAITPVLLGLIMSTGTRPAPATSVDPTGVVSSQPNTLPTVPTPTARPDVTPTRSGAGSSPTAPGAGAPSPTAGPPQGTGSRSPGASPTNPGVGSQAPATPSPNAATAAPSPNPG